ncbi:MAG: LLM class flavin-dependent oxidoreductase [Dehalococcoidia bacterium]|nr:LLM class flavin-dependent oxidoreductase [Dehalococcoidia bacterium]
MRLGLRSERWNDDWRAALEKVRIAEELGYELVTTGETWGASAIPWLTILALHTSRIQLGTSIVNVFGRSPGVLAQEFAVLDQLSGGRALLGLGASGELVIEHFHGAKFERPLQRLREYVEIINVLMRGQPLNYEGEIFQLSRGFRLDCARVRDHVPIFVAALTPRSIRQAGEIADGIMPLHWPKSRFGALREQLADAARAAGREHATLTIAPWTFAYVLDGQRDEEQWRAARQPLQFYINRMGVFYWQMLARNGFESEVAASRAAWAERDAEGSLAAISEAMVRDIQVIGPLASVREQLRERAALGADVQLLNMPAGDPVTVGTQLEALLR